MYVLVNLKAKEKLGFAKKNYEALNTQLLEEIPGFTEKCMSLVVDCLENFAMAQNRLYYEIQQEYEQLLQVPVLITAIGRRCLFRKKSLELGL